MNSTSSNNTTLRSTIASTLSNISSTVSNTISSMYNSSTPNITTSNSSTPTETTTSTLSSNSSTVASSQKEDKEGYLYTVWICCVCFAALVFLGMFLEHVFRVWKGKSDNRPSYLNKSASTHSLNVVSSSSIERQRSKLSNRDSIHSLNVMSDSIERNKDTNPTQNLTPQLKRNTSNKSHHDSPKVRLKRTPSNKSHHDSPQVRHNRTLSSYEQEIKDKIKRTPSKSYYDYTKVHQDCCIDMSDFNIPENPAIDSTKIEKTSTNKTRKLGYFTLRGRLASMLKRNDKNPYEDHAIDPREEEQIPRRPRIFDRRSSIETRLNNELLKKYKRNNPPSPQNCSIDSIDEGFEEQQESSRG
ncbi:hypothetical protein K6025_05155 [Ehrlichia sp. JZT12]